MQVLVIHVYHQLVLGSSDPPAHINHDRFTGTGAIILLPDCQGRNLEGNGNTQRHLETWLNFNPSTDK